nr:MAG TPA: hypothetical protein [Caudoviricetes sp.]
MIFNYFFVQNAEFYFCAFIRNFKIFYLYFCAF